MSNEIVVGRWSIYQRPKTKKARTKHGKSPELAEFEREYNAHEYDRLPNIPEAARVRTKFEDGTANGLTACIIAHLKHNGHFAARVNTTGIYDSMRGRYRTANARKGMADISAIINGKAVQIEVKAGKDRPRPEQIRVQTEYRASGGVYEFVHTFAEYLQFYQQWTAENGK